LISGEEEFDRGSHATTRPSNQKLGHFDLSQFRLVQ